MSQENKEPQTTRIAHEASDEAHKHPHQEDSRLIVVAVDPHYHESKFDHKNISDKAFREAVRIMRPQDKLVVLAAVDIQKTMTSAYTAGFATYGVKVDESMREFEENISKEVLRKYGRLCREHEVKHFELVMRRGDPRDAIIEASEEREADLIVIGCRSLGTIQRMFLGSVSNYILHHSKINTLIVK
eukprot:gb/GECH01003550.1/.p1 GENE.gb/GECH01003550.1/~~gb/GECH01003550.1/.p1  ORF type:complete len:187 (+),score=53.73 gb/GECH01003550.1/:1-561(+)